MTQTCMQECHDVQDLDTGAKRKTRPLAQHTLCQAFPHLWISVVASGFGCAKDVAHVSASFRLRQVPGIKGMVRLALRLHAFKPPFWCGCLVQGVVLLGRLVSLQVASRQPLILLVQASASALAELRRERDTLRDAAQARLTNERAKRKKKLLGAGGFWGGGGGGVGQLGRRLCFCFLSVSPLRSKLSPGFVL